MSAAANSSPPGVARIAARFAENTAHGRKALAPFVTAGDPDPETTAGVLAAIDRAGATLIELGVPYSDPIADGAVIQSSYVRALDAGMSLDRLFAMMGSVAPRLATPVLAMASYSIIFRRGITRFVSEAVAAGFAGFVVPDLPLEESDDLDLACRTSGLALVRLVTPTTPPDRAEQIARRSTGFLYCVSVAGVTGARTVLPEGLIDRVKWLRTKTSVPILVGFGISTPEQARAVAAVADGVIVGSALVKHLVAAGTSPRGEVIAAIETHCRDLAAALT